MVLKVKAAMLDPMAHQDLREALVSLVSKDSWATSESEGLKESLDPKENLVCQALRECSDLRAKKESEDNAETPAPWAPSAPLEREELPVTGDSPVLMGCQDQRAL